jgi:transposase
MLRVYVTADSAAYLDEYCTRWKAATGVQVSLSAMSREIRKLGITRKQGRWVPVSATSARAVPGTAS